MANYKIDNEIFVTILRIRKNNNRADLDSIYKEIKKSIDFQDITKEFLDDRIHTLINDGKIINKLNRNANSYYVNSNLSDLERPNLLTSSQSISPCRFHIKFQRYTSKQNSPVTRDHINPHHIYTKFF